jgi:uncharacterized membrane protein
MMPAMPERPLAEPLIERLRILAVACLLGLIVLGLAWELWLAPTGNRTLALKVLPLALAFVGLLKHRMYTYRWLSLLVWLYFTEGVVRAASERGIVVALGLTEVTLSLLLFTACVLHVRRRLQRAALQP